MSRFLANLFAGVVLFVLIVAAVAAGLIDRLASWIKGFMEK